MARRIEVRAAFTEPNDAAEESERRDPLRPAGRNLEELDEDVNPGVGRRTNPIVRPSYTAGSCGLDLAEQQALGDSVAHPGDRALRHERIVAARPKRVLPLRARQPGQQLAG